ncbi:hypothetical protein B0T21DRAFT_427628 [Apiosordaria backusii]|uniref:Uncharacterized protein n=1 Tax=Apiosordaria backusii TaxID=314023 RepID=A0AA40DR65_9PEZI|nr:hypothetical protein B0T21DRAFT_427628 [Apiosordaria backusii]
MPPSTFFWLAGAMTLAAVGAQGTLLPTTPIFPIPFSTPSSQYGGSISFPAPGYRGPGATQTFILPTPPPNRPSTSSRPKKPKNNLTKVVTAVNTPRKTPFVQPTGGWRSLEYPYTTGRRTQRYMFERAPADCASQTSYLTALAAQQPVFPPELQSLAEKHKVWFSACGPTFENAADPSFDPQAFTPAFQAWQDTLATNLRRLMNACHNSQETVDAIDRDPCLRGLLAQAPVIPLGPLPEGEQATFTTLFTIEIPDPTPVPADPVTVTEMSTAWLTATMVVEENRTVVIDEPRTKSEGIRGVALSMTALVAGMLAGLFVFASQL